MRNAMSQGYIGYHLQQAMHEALIKIKKGHIPVNHHRDPDGG